MCLKSKEIIHVIFIVAVIKECKICKIRRKKILQWYSCFILVTLYKETKVKNGRFKDSFYFFQMWINSVDCKAVYSDCNKGFLYICISITFLTHDIEIDTRAKKLKSMIKRNLFCFLYLIFKSKEYSDKKDGIDFWSYEIRIYSSWYFITSSIKKNVSKVS